MPAGALRPLKTAERIALAIVREIVELGLDAGDPLPKEADLTEKYSASRASVREALRLLEVQGLIEVHRGSHVGTTVGEVRAANLARTLTLYFHMAGTTYDEIFDTWFVIEPLLVESATRNPDKERVAQLIGPFAGIENFEWETYVNLHDAVFTLASNRALAFLGRAVGMLSAIMLRDVSEERVGEFSEDYRRIASAVLSGDATLARAAMSQHIEQVIEMHKQLSPERVGARVTSDEIEQIQLAALRVS